MHRAIGEPPLPASARAPGGAARVLPAAAAMPQHQWFPMDDASRVGEARRAAAACAADMALDPVAAGRLAIVVTELGTNLLRHAQGGRLQLTVRDGAGGRAIEVLAVDDGPGLADLGACLRDGYSTGGTAGTGLGAIRRQADDFDCYSLPGRGTVMLARIRPTPRNDTGPPAAQAGVGGGVGGGVAVGGAALAAPGETVCGDGWAWACEGSRASVIVADGLGHGPLAAEASRAALQAFAREPFAAPAQLLQRCHAALRATRGAAVTVLQADAHAGQVCMAGAGNVLARVVSGTTDRTLLPQSGAAGVAIRTPQEQVLEWPAHALLVLHTDGIPARWSLDDPAGLLSRDPAVIAGVLLRDHLRGRDDATVVVLARPRD